MNFLPILLFWGCAFWALSGGPQRLIYLLFGSMAFGSFAVIPPEITGGLTFTGAPIAALLLCARVFAAPEAARSALQSATDPRRLGLLTLFWFVAIIVTLFAPRLFNGQIEIIAVRGLVARPIPLAPSPQNVSQAFYLTISVFTVVAFTQILKTPAGLQGAIRALCFGGLVTLLTGLLDMAGHSISLGWLLDPFRTATYAMLTDVEVLGARRLVGLMPEASAYGGLCLTQAAGVHFLGRSLPDGRMRRMGPAITLALLVMAALSTSSATYVGLIIFVGVAAFDWMTRAAAASPTPDERKRLGGELAFMGAAVLGLVIVVLLAPGALSPITEMFDRMVLQKTSSQSYVERSMWTRVSWEALLSTHGFGVGIGGTRASNRIVALASNTGFLGLILFLGFLLLCYLRPLAGQDRRVRAAVIAARFTYAPLFFVGLLVGTGADFGLFAAFLFGTMVMRGPQPQSAPLAPRQSLSPRLAGS